MNRREFIHGTGLATGGLIAGVSCGIAPKRSEKSLIHWRQEEASKLFAAVSCDGEPCVQSDAPALLDAACRLWSEAPEQATRLGPGQASSTHGPLRLELSHRLHESGATHGEDVLEARLAVRNVSDEPQQVEVTFLTSAHPPSTATDQHLYLPLNAAGLSGDKRFIPLGVGQFLKDCNQLISEDAFLCHYLEPRACYPDEVETRAQLLVPVVDISNPSAPWHVALFAPSDAPIRFNTSIAAGHRVWRAGRVVTVQPGEELTERCCLMLHTGDASVAWKAFHRLAHEEAHPPIGWVCDFKVHYYDFLSPAGEDSPRGRGYDADLPHFGEFRVGLGTQHGYYPCMGDHLHPDRPEWLAMQSDPHGPVEMSFETIQARIKATRATGAKAGIYMHMSALDDSSQVFYPGLAADRRIDPDGQPVRFGWNGPDVKGKLWWMSMSSPDWRAHLLQQAEWIMELFQPDAICVDETFSGVGYDYRTGQPEPLSSYAIEFFGQLHSLVRSYGSEKALFSSDCSMAGFSLWADGEVGDHAYGSSLGNPLYSQEPVRYLAALGDKPWRPCAWHWQSMWEHQMRLARQVGSGVGVSNGWLEYTGLAGLPEPARSKTLADIATLF